MTKRHKTFISYYHADDEQYRNEFERLFGAAYVSKSVEVGDIDTNLQTETIRRKIRDEYLRDSTVTVVLIGKNTWKRKHIDWEISSSIRHTEYNPRSGLLGIFLPTHPDYGREKYTPHKIPPRLHYNVKCKFAKLYDWTTNINNVIEWIHEAFENRNKVNPDNSFPMFKNNRSGDEWQ
ncbi:TIR domain-containing protein [Candidatus Lokiarchaeum ossiferum]|uniref:TIR domain-containing protein n=1 Tax=Candidatus Lokiarchaeum ossiferum TaxID=2951803 RepID=UPI00352EA7F9